MASTREDRIVEESLAEFAQLQVYRNLFGAHWEEVANILAPNYRNTFFVGTYNFPGQKNTQLQVDSTAMLALDRFGAILDSMLTPQNGMWHALRASDEDLMKNRSVAVYFDQLTKALFHYRYDPSANFSSQNQSVYQSLGAFGNGIMYIDEFAGHSGAKGLRYRHVPLGEMFFRENFQGMIDGYCRWFRLTKRQAVQWFGQEKLSEGLLNAQNSEQQFEFIQRVCPNDEYSEGHPGPKGKLYSSYYIELTGQKLCKESGYPRFPMAITRYTQVNGIEVYGRGPAMKVLPTIKTLNSQKTDFLTQGHLAVNPVYLTTDDGLVDWNRRPGAINKGGLALDGTPMVKVLEHGDIQVSIEMMQEEKQIIDSAFLVDLFKILLDDPKIYTATQVVEMMSQRGILLAPTIGRQQSEYLAPMIDRELDLLGMQRLLPPMPPALKEAGGDYKVLYTSPLARSMRAADLAGLNRSFERALQISQVTGDPSPMFHFDFDTIIPEAADIDGVPAHWMSSPEQVAQKKQAHQQQLAQQQQINAAPAAAALSKAETQRAQAGLQPQQGQPQGGQ